MLIDFNNYTTYLTLNETIGSDNVRDVSALNKFRRSFTMIITNFKFFAELLFNLRIVEANPGSRYETMATDGKSIIYNPDFVNKLSEEEVIFVILHEIMHCANLHFARIGGREHDLWNQAADYAINIQLSDMKDDMKSTTFTPPKYILLDDKYRNMSAEIIYDILYKENPPKPPESGNKLDCPHCGKEIKNIYDHIIDKQGNTIVIKCPHCGEKIVIELQDPPPGGGGGGKPEPVECPHCDEEIDNILSHRIGDGKFGNAKFKCPHCGGEFELPVSDDPSQGGGEGEGEGGGSDPREVDDFEEDGKGLGDGKRTDTIGDDIASPGDLDNEGEVVYEGNTSLGDMDKGKVKEAWKKIRIDAASNSRGTGSASFDRWIRKTTTPKINWKTELKRFISQIYSELNYGYFNKRFMSRDLYLPGLKSTDKSIYDNVVIAIDTSGSINDVTLGKFGAELETLFKKHKIKKCHIIWCDSEIKSVQTFDVKKEKFKLDRLVPKGGGGTSFFPPFVWVQKNILKRGKTPAFFIYFTDAYGDAPKATQYGIKGYFKRVLWVITDNDNASNLKFGKKIYLDNI